MTTMPGREAPAVDGFVERPCSPETQNFQGLHRPRRITALGRHFDRPDTTLVLGEMPVDWRPPRRKGQLYPGLLADFKVDVHFAIDERGFAIENLGQPPNSTLEVAPQRTAGRDCTPNPWPADGEYWPIDAKRLEDDHYWGGNVVLNLGPCWEYAQLPWYAPVAQRYLRTHDRTHNEDANEDAEERMAAEAQCDAKRQARIAVEAEIAGQQAWIRRLEEELRCRRQPRSSFRQGMATSAVSLLDYVMLWPFAITAPNIW